MRGRRSPSDRARWLPDDLAVVAAPLNTALSQSGVCPIIPTLSVAGAAFVVFASTNIDDLFVLAAFFADRRIRRRSIVLGQFFGIAALVFASIALALAAVAVPERWVSLLGAVPLGIGCWKLVSEVRRGAASDDDPASGAARDSVRSQLLAVTGVTIANGADNLSVYIPIFATQPARIPVYVAVFAVLVAVWCLFGYLLVSNRVAGTHIRRFGRFILPIALVAVGSVILAEGFLL